jgi:hypothetical protein
MTTTFTREELKREMPDVIAAIQKHHVMESNIYQELYINHKPVKGLCHERGYFVIVGDLFLQYTMEHIIQDVQLQLIGRRVTSVTVYDTFQEYEAERVKRMSGSKDQTGLNFN